MKKLTPVIMVEQVEPCLPFWEQRLGFTRTIEVPHEHALGFVALQRGGVEVMLQSRASVQADVPDLAAAPVGPGNVGLFIEVDDLEPILKAAEGAEIVVPERRTFYGMREIGLRAPGGPVVMFAQRIDES
ncbi:MAG: VOC family protein [Phycisphaerales bacterium JB039]